MADPQQPLQGAEPSAGQSRRGYHRIATYAECPQRFAYKYRLGMQPLYETGKRGLGSLLHLGLMYHYRRLAGLGNENPVEQMRWAPRSLAVHFEPARLIYAEYCSKYPKEPFDVLEVEQEHEVTILGRAVTCRFDLVIKQRDRIFVVDHKSHGGRDVGEHHREWEFSGQMILQEAIGAARFPALYNIAFGGVLINAIGTSAPYRFARSRLQIDPLLREPCLRSLAEYDELIDADEGRDPWSYRRNHSSCVGRYGTCDFLPLCRRGKFAAHEYSGG